MFKNKLLQIIIKRIAKLEIKLTKMNEGIEQQHLEHTSNINKSDYDIIGDTLLCIEEELKYIENTDNIDNIDNYKEHL